MKTWLIKCKRAAIIVAGLIAVALIGILLYGVNYEPQSCSLCGDGMKYHAPVILDLSSGEVAELRVYEPHPYLVGEIAEIQTTGYMGLSMSAGIMMYTDPGKSCRATMPENHRRIKKSLYCRKCRELLTEVSTEGYALLDLYDPANVKVYPIINGASYEIRDYSVAILENTVGDSLQIEAVGHI